MNELAQELEQAGQELDDLAAENEDLKAKVKTLEREANRLAERLLAVRSSSSIQAQVEQLVLTFGRPVTAAELLEQLPPGTRQQTVNWALWKAAREGRIRKLFRGAYGA